MKWIVSGIWDHTGETGSLTVTAGSKPEAYAAAKSRGLSAIEAMGAGAPSTNGTSTATPPRPKAARRQRARVEANPSPPPSTDAPPATTATVPRPRMARHPAASLREKAARLAVPSNSTATGLLIGIVGLLVIFVGTYLTVVLPPNWWLGEAAQVAGFLGVLVCLRALND